MEATPHKATFQSNFGLVDRVQGRLRNGRLSIDEDGSDIDLFPLDGNFGGSVDTLDRVCDFRSNSITGNQRDLLEGSQRTSGRSKETSAGDGRERFGLWLW